MRSKRRREAKLIQVSVAAAAATAAIGIAATHSRDAYDLDHRVRRQMRRHSTRRMNRVAEFISAIGEPSAQVPLSVIAGAMLGCRREHPFTDPATYAPTAAVLTAIAAHHGIKAAFPRKRPLTARLSGKTEPSYPSGHATVTTALAATIAMLVSDDDASPAMRRVLMAGSAIPPAIVGLARAYSGKHWASDVLGGWALGLSIAAATSGVVKASRPSRAGGRSRRSR